MAAFLASLTLVINADFGTMPHGATGPLEHFKLQDPQPGVIGESRVVPAGGSIARYPVRIVVFETRGNSYEQISR